MFADEILLCDTAGMVKSAREEGRNIGRKTLSIRADVAATFKEVCKAKPIGRSMDDTATRLIDWFNRQRALVRSAATGDVDEGMEAAYIMALRDMADALERKVKGEDQLEGPVVRDFKGAVILPNPQRESAKRRTAPEGTSKRS